MPTLNHADARNGSRGVRLGTYLDVAARAPMSDRVARELRGYLESSQHEGALKRSWLARVYLIRQMVADYVGANS